MSCYSVVVIKFTLMRIAVIGKLVINCRQGFATEICLLIVGRIVFYNIVYMSPLPYLILISVHS